MAAREYGILGLRYLSVVCVLEPSGEVIVVSIRVQVHQFCFTLYCRWGWSAECNSCFSQEDEVLESHSHCLLLSLYDSMANGKFGTQNISWF